LSQSGRNILAALAVFFARPQADRQIGASTSVHRPGATREVIASTLRLRFASSHAYLARP